MSARPVVDPSRVDRPRGLVRSRDDRMIAGVAGGIGQHLGVDPVIVRLVFVVLAVVGGGGVLAYLIAWVVIPDAPVDGQPSPPPSGSGTSVIAGLGLIALGGVLLVDLLLPGLSWRFVGPLLLIGLGGLLLARGGARR